MQDTNITSLIKLNHRLEVGKKLLTDVHQEMKQGVPKALVDEVKMLINQTKSNLSKSKVAVFPLNRSQLASTQLMAAAGQSIGDWFAQPIVFAASGFVVDIRKVLGSQNAVDIYINPNGSDVSMMEEALLPFRDKSFKILMSVNGNELLSADIYVDESGHAAEGTGFLKQVQSDNLHGELSIEVNEKD